MRSAVRLFILAGVFMAASRAWAASPQEVWKKLEAKLSKADDVTTEIGFYTWYPETLKKYYPEAKEEMKSNPGGWRYQKLEYAWKKPNRVWMKFITARNMGADLAQKIVEENPGTRVIYGYKDTKFIYGRFPDTKKTRLLSANIAHEIYPMPADNLKYSSNLTKMGYDTTPSDLILGRARYFKEGTVTVEEGKYVRKDDFRMKGTEVRFKSEEVPGDHYIFTFKPKSAEKNKGITHEIMYIEKATLMPVQVEMYHGKILVACITIKGIKLNTKFDDKVWEDFYKDAAVVSQMKGSTKP